MMPYLRLGHEKKLAFAVPTYRCSSLYIYIYIRSHFGSSLEFCGRVCHTKVEPVSVVGKLDFQPGVLAGINLI